MIYTTVIKATDPLDGELKMWQGPNVEAISWTYAEQYLQENGLGYCKVDGVLHSEVDWNTGQETIIQELN